MLEQIPSLNFYLGLKKTGKDAITFIKGMKKW